MASEVAKNPRITSAQWEKAKPQIARLYKDANLPLKRVKEQMSERYGFIASSVWNFYNVKLVSQPTVKDNTEPSSTPGVPCGRKMRKLKPSSL
jgi:hypothetical protein